MKECHQAQETIGVVEYSLEIGNGRLNTLLQTVPRTSRATQYSVEALTLALECMNLIDN